jgi:integrase
VLAISTRSPTYIELMELRMNVHVLPFFADKDITTVNKGMVQAYRVQRAEKTIEKTTVRDEQGEIIKQGKPPARNTILQEITAIRQVLKHAEGLGWIPYVPSLSMPYMTQSKIGRRAWFSPDEYKRLYEATRRRITKGKRRGWKKRYQDLHDFVLFMANTGLRPDEALNLEIRDVHIEDDYATKKTILVIDVRGKVGVGYAKSMPNAVHPFEEVRKRREQQLRDGGRSDEEIQRLLSLMKVFPEYDRHTFNAILDEENLKFDRDGKRRTAYSLRHTYISMRLMEGANIHQLANNCRTSVQMIEEHYASHIKDRIDAASINIMRPKAARKAAKKSAAEHESAPEAHR